MKTLLPVVVAALLAGYAANHSNCVSREELANYRKQQEQINANLLVAIEAHSSAIHDHNVSIDKQQIRTAQLQGDLKQLATATELNVKTLVLTTENVKALAGMR
jgi:hypothetical protein